jgi:hypothetical protein
MLGIAFATFPLSGSLLGSPPSDLHDVTARPFLLVLTFSSVEIIGDATVNDLVTYL